MSFVGKNSTSETKHLTLESASISNSEGLVRKRRPLQSYFLYAFLLLSITHFLNTLISASTTHPDSRQSDTGITNNTFDWEKVKPSTELEWHSCFPNRECARLSVPLDYSDPNNEKAAIALIRIKAKVSPSSDKYRGPILFNPGGPGVSGVSMIDKTGEFFHDILGDDYDIVGFDPRGVGLTTPAVSVFSDPFERSSWYAGEAPLINSTSDAILRAYTRSELLGDLSVKRTMHAAQHVATATVARDMLTITQAHGRDKLKYWGFSYGTVLGATYAGLFPDNIERLVIDGVVDFDDYYSGSWSQNLKDTDKIVQLFYKSCVAAGPACPLHANTSNSVRHRLENIITTLKQNPLPVLDTTGSTYAVVDYSMVKSALFRALYKPFTELTLYAHVLAALERGDGGPALAYWKAVQPQLKCGSKPKLSVEIPEALFAIMCGDGEGVGRNMEDVEKYFEELSTVSMFADVWAGVTRTECAGWKIKAKNRYGGPFNTSTSFPLLIIGNTADPVTPLIGAMKAAHGFKGSSLLTIDTPGHCSIAATSPSAVAHIRRYFRDGILPPAGTVCEIEDQFFGSKKVRVLHQATKEERGAVKAARKLSRLFNELRARGGYLL